jgi:DNA-binding MarR family transcriptional regulator
MVMERLKKSKATVDRCIKRMEKNGMLKKTRLEGASRVLIELSDEGLKRYQEITTVADRQEATMPDIFSEYINRFAHHIRSFRDKEMGHKETRFRKTLVDLLSYENPFSTKYNEPTYYAIIFYLATRDITNNLLTVTREDVARCIDDSIFEAKIEDGANDFAEIHHFFHYRLYRDGQSFYIYLHPESEVVQIIHGIARWIIDKYFIENEILYHVHRADFIIRQEEQGRQPIDLLRKQVIDKVSSLEIPELRWNQYIELFINQAFITELAKNIRKDQQWVEDRFKRQLGRRGI